MYKRIYLKFRGQSAKKPQINNSKIVDVTIVTLCLELSERLKLTLNSVNLQDYKVRHILVDGSNNTEISDFCAEYFPNVEVFRQSPRGIYSAMNFGLDKVDRDSYVMFLNEADFLVGPNAISDFLNVLSNEKTWGFGSTIAFSMNNQNLHQYGYRISDWRIFQRGQQLIPHPSLMVPAAWLKDLNGFKPQYRIAGDTELTFRIFKQYGPATFVNRVIAAHETGGVSTELIARSNFESRMARLRHFPIVTLKKMLMTLVARRKSREKHPISCDPEIKVSHFDVSHRSEEFPLCCRLELNR